MHGRTNPAEKSGLDFFAGFVLAEKLCDEARQKCAKFYTFLFLKKSKGIPLGLFFCTNQINQRQNDAYRECDNRTDRR